MKRALHVVSIDGWRDVEPGEMVYADLLSYEKYTRKCNSCPRQITSYGGSFCVACENKFQDVQGWSTGWDETITIEQWKEEQMAQGRTKVAKIRKQLEEQGLIVKPKSKGGWQVRGDSGIVHIHTSQLTGPPHTVKNIMSQLSAIGFDPDHGAWKREQNRLAHEAKLKEEAAAEAAEKKLREKEKKAKPPVESPKKKPKTDKSRGYAYEPEFRRRYQREWHNRKKAGLDTRGAAEYVRQQMAAEAATPEPTAAANGHPAATPVKRRVLPDEQLTDLAKMRKLNERVARSSEVLAEASRAMLERYENLERENQDLKTRLSRVEKKIESLVDAF